jgi:hypothetical protein
MMTDAVWIERSASQFYSVPWVLYTLSGVLVRIQPKGVKSKKIV